jgi:glycerol transport system ATP-binding protein
VLELGVRPEFVRFADAGIPVRIGKVSDAGRHRVVETRHEGAVIRLLVDEGAPVPAEGGHLRFDPAFTQLFADGWTTAVEGPP